MITMESNSTNTIQFVARLIFVALGNRENDRKLFEMPKKVFPNLDK